MILKGSIFIIFLSIISLSSISHCQTIYKWVDEKGNIHYSTRYEKIPQEYRNQVQKPEIAEEAETAEKAQPKEGEVRPPVISPVEERAEIQTVPSLPQPEGKLRDEKIRLKIEFEGRYWITDLTAEARVTETGIGTEIDKADLGLTDENHPDLRFTWYTGPKSKLRLAYAQLAYSGDKIIERTFEFGGSIYPAGSRVVTDFAVQHLRLGWAWQFINVIDGKVKLGTLLEAAGFFLKSSLETPNLIPPKGESARVRIAFPTIGGALNINPHKVVNVFTEVSGIYAGRYVYFLDGEAGVKIIPLKNFSIVGGWRVLSFTGKDDDDFVKLRISGPFIGATLRF